MCSLSKPHRYESHIFDEATLLETREVTFERIHCGHKLFTEAEQRIEWAAITQVEHWTRGEVTLKPPVVSVYGDSDVTDYTVAEAYARAAEMRDQADQLAALADTLERILDAA